MNQYGYLDNGEVACLARCSGPGHYHNESCHVFHDALVNDSEFPWENVEAFEKDLLRRGWTRKVWANRDEEMWYCPDHKPESKLCTWCGK